MARATANMRKELRGIASELEEIYPIFARCIKGLDYIDKSYLWKLKGRWL
ncbi:hypothetical protein I6U48_03935 [Clostridium sp. PL3]|uniref:Uncharacterized protein n=1 Tax=Clostridium thailandense TaxID=2794346 RepID=A0A949TML7_9CLOT|nr:hypothetical protein [Clostridium thailandense]MBV7272067.1 hypothetical protein [Clostridium thailandense]